MRLKKLEVYGFKSFADPTEFDFEPGVTAIVGPNGCGKSNVVDAIKWILGEQSARSLRGQQMMDVVFNGSKTRKALGFAEATLVFEGLTTSDGRQLSEVQITRRLFRSGESEYQINRETARLKDIKDLFLDTGVGMQAYSIIEQGRIDAILTKSAGDRRAIFEEAAGISRYKRRRLEAERKLERTDGNLLRVNDRLEEVERRLRALRSQAAKARRYREHEARLRELRVRHALHDYVELVAEHERVHTELVAREREVETMRQAAEASDAEVAEHEGAASELEAQLEDLARARAEFDRAATQANAEVEHGQVLVEEILAAAQASEMELARLEEHSARDRVEFAALGVEYETCHLQAESGRQALESLRNEDATLAGAITDGRREIESLEAEQAALAGRRTEVANRQAELGARIAVERSHCERLEGERAAVQAEIDALKSERETRDREVAALVETIGSMTRSYHAREEESRSAERALEDLASELGRASEHYHALRSRHELLERIIERREGVGGGVRAVLAARERGDPAAAALLGLVADLVVTDPEHYPAVEAVLADAADTLVCRDRAGAERVARIMSALAAGRGRVLAAAELDQPETRDQRAATVARAVVETGVRGQLADVVRPGRFLHDGAERTRGAYAPGASGVFRRDSSGRYQTLAPLVPEEESALVRRVLGALIGDVMVVDGLGRAHELAARMPSLRFVTPRGELAAGALLAVGAGTAVGTLPGAPPGEEGGSGLIAQRNELRRLGDRVADEAAAVDRAKEARTSAAHGLAALEAELQRMRGEIYDANIAHTEKRAASRHIEEGIAARRRSVEAIAESLLAAGDAVARLAGAGEALAREVDGIQQRSRAAEERAAEVRAEVAANEVRRGELGEGLRTRELEIARAEEQRLALARAMRGLEAALAERASRAGRLAASAAESGDRAAAARQAIAAARVRAEEKARERQVLDGRLVEVGQRRAQARKRIEEARAEVRSAREAAERAFDALAGLRTRSSETRIQSEALVLRVREEYRIELEALRRRRLGLPPLETPPPAPAPAGEGTEPAPSTLPAASSDGSGSPGGSAPGEPAPAPDPEAEARAAAAEEARRAAQEEELERLAAPVELEWAVVATEIQELRQRMANLGSVNLEAIEEFDEVEKRFSELAAQREDLVQAKARLEQLIGELNVRSRELFVATLDQVRESFKDVFRHLFGGGSSDIVLGEGDPLDAGVDIVAKPPGKEPASISLLSGGEKSLTAVALLFALFRSRPSPFCILDEVDAALDEANVTRFVSMLKDYLGDTQFVIITHNKRTMSVADVIHGVTMQERGVSRRITVKLEEVA